MQLWEVKAISMRFLVAQIGARMHYAVPRILSERGLLGCFFTDIVSSKPPLSYVCRLPSCVLSRYGAMLSRRTPQGIDKRLIKTFPLFGCIYALRRYNARSRSERTPIHLWANRTFTALVNRRADWINVDSVYAFNGAALELLTEAKKRGKRTILEQTIAPRSVERELLSAEALKWPGWSGLNGEDVREQEICEREEAEWNVADIIICGSQFVRDGIVKCAPRLANRCAVVPYGYDGVGDDVAERMKRGRCNKLRILTAGAVGLRKGTPYVVEAAKKTLGLAELKLAGPIIADATVLQNLPPNVEILGQVSVDEMISLYSWADLFLLPSFCEGSATVTYEAISMGVPVICTPNTGSVVRDGVDGYIVPPGSSEAICERLATLHDDPDLLSWMSCQALERSQEFSVAAYGERLIQALS